MGLGWIGLVRYVTLPSALPGALVGLLCDFAGGLFGGADQVRSGSGGEGGPAAG